MLTKYGNIKCDDCGRFISFFDLLDNLAIHVLVEPSSHKSEETYDSFCKNCLTKYKEDFNSYEQGFKEKYE